MSTDGSFQEITLPGQSIFVLDKYLYAQFQAFIEDAQIQHWFTHTGEDYD